MTPAARTRPIKAKNTVAPRFPQQQHNKEMREKNLQKHRENKQVKCYLAKPSIIHFTKYLLHITIHT